jgi:DNA-binding transcriptional ArsR family regulator
MPTSRIRRDAYKDVFGALAHPARRGVLLAVYFKGGAMTAGDIAAMFAHAWQTTTRHLQVLEAAGLLTHERQGRMRIYRIERKRLALVGDWLAHFQVPVRQRAGGKQDVRNKKTTAVKTKPPKREAPDDVPQFFRLNVEVGDLDAATTFYTKPLGVQGRKQPGHRCYFDCGPVTLQVLDVSRRAGRTQRQSLCTLRSRI